MRTVNCYKGGQKFAQPSVKQLFPHSFGLDDVTPVTCEATLTDDTDAHANQRSLCGEFKRAAAKRRPQSQPLTHTPPHFTTTPFPLSHLQLVIQQQHSNRAVENKVSVIFHPG